MKKLLVLSLLVVLSNGIAIRAADNQKRRPQLSEVILSAQRDSMDADEYFPKKSWVKTRLQKSVSVPEFRILLEGPKRERELLKYKRFSSFSSIFGLRK